MRLTNSGEKRLRTATSAIACSLLVRSLAGRSLPPADWKPKSGLISFIISRAPRLLVRKTRLFSKLTVELSPRRRTPLIQHAQQQTCHGRRGFFDFVEEHQRKPATI